MAQFILIHGSFHGPWCWTPILPQLREAGHSVTLANLELVRGAPDLVSYANHVTALIDTLPGPVILVGHSMGGLVASQAAEWRASRVKKIIYIAGLLLRNGETLTSFIEAHADLGVRDLVLETMQVSPDGSLAHFPPSAAPGIFYNRCEPEEAEWAASRLRPQPTAVYATPLALSASAFGRIPRAYIKAAQDRAVAPAYQDAMVERTKCDPVITLDSDHSPFLSMPGELAALLTELSSP